MTEKTPALSGENQNGESHWRLLAKAIEPSVCGGDAAFVK